LRLSGKGKSLRTAQQTTTTHESSGKKSRQNSKAQLSFAPAHVDQPRPGIESDVSADKPGASLGTRVNDDARRKEKIQRQKIFAKIEWKDTSKNPTGSKNNSLSE